jgi:hypothetical protein
MTPACPKGHGPLVLSKHGTVWRCRGCGHYRDTLHPKWAGLRPGEGLRSAEGEGACRGIAAPRLKSRLRAPQDATGAA